MSQENLIVLNKRCEVKTLELLDLDRVSDSEGIIRFFKLYVNHGGSETPNSFWTSTNGCYRAKVIVKYLIENLLGYTRRVQVIRRLSKSDFTMYNLGNMLHLLFDDNIFLAVDNAYPNVYKQCMFEGRRNYWDTELIREEVELIAKESGKDVRDLKVSDIKKADFYGGDAVFRRLYGSFENFMASQYPPEKWWIPRVPGIKRSEWTDEQEKKAVTYLLKDELGIDVRDTKHLHYVTTNDLFDAHMGFLCKKYNYSVRDLINKYYPDLKIVNRKALTYTLVSPNGEEYRVENMRMWVEENKDKLNINAGIMTIAANIRRAARKTPPNNTYHKWVCSKEN